MSEERKRMLGALGEGFSLGVCLIVTIDAAFAEPFRWQTMSLLLLAQAWLWTRVVLKIRKLPK